MPSAEYVPNRSDDEPRGVDRNCGPVRVQPKAQHDRANRRLVPHEPTEPPFSYDGNEACDHQDRDRVSEREQQEPDDQHRQDAWGLGGRGMNALVRAT